MFTIPEQFSNATKTTFESQLAAFTTLTSKAFESMEKVVDLNITAAKASLEDSAAAAKQLLSAKDPQEFFAVATSQTQPNVAKAIAYGRHLTTIASSTQAEFTRTAEEQVAAASRQINTLVDDVSKAAPAGSENIVAIVKSAIGNANAGYEQFSKTTKQAVEVMETNLNTAVTQFTQAAEKTASAATRARK